MQGALETLGIPYTGSGVMASALAMDKWRTKLVWLRAASRRRAIAVVDAATDWMRVVAELGLPLIVKPAREGSTIGITKVTTVDHGELALAYDEAAKHDDLVLVEEFVAGIELTASILGDARAAADPDRGAAGQLRLSQQVLLRRDEVLLSVRPARGEGARDPRRSLAAFDIVGCTRLGPARPHPAADGSFQFLEVNTSPGMTGHSLVPMAAKAGGNVVPRPLRRDPARRACGMTRNS